MRIDSILLFEPEQTELLYPFSIMHPLWELRCGCLRLFEKLQKRYPNARLIFHGRDLQLASFLERFEIDQQDLRKENILIFHSAILPDSDFLTSLENSYDNFLKSGSESKSVAFTHNEVPVAIYLDASEYINPSADKDRQFLIKLFDEYGRVLPQVEVREPKVINFLWDALDFNAHSINDDAVYFQNDFDFDYAEKHGSHFINKSAIKIGSGSSIAPGCVIDASEGYIIIGSNVKIMPNSVIIGPCFIGDNSIVKIAAKIYQDCSFGEHCKIGGEIENSIFLAYSNKQHDGFLGHSYICQWVNLGANTNNSDLKNTYDNIKVQFKDKEFDSGRTFLGLLCGDHTKSAINTSFNTGTVSGICAVLFYEGFHPKFIKSFSWGGRKDSMIYKLDKAIEIARTVMARRGKALLPADEALLKDEYERTKLS